MKFSKLFLWLFALSALLLLIGVIHTTPGRAQSPAPKVYLPFVANNSSQPANTPTPKPTLEPEWQYGYVAKNQVWVQRPSIPVCWVNPATANNNERLWVQQAILDTWERQSTIRFVGWGQCPAANDQNGIRIQIADTGPHVKTLGQAIRSHNEGMVLNFTFQNWSPNCASSEIERRRCIEVIAVHEFGHALAFAHEQNRPDTPAWCDQEQGQNGDVIVGEWDVNSVMNYCNLNWSGNGVLSNGDILTLQTFYGVPPTPTPTATPTVKPNTPTPLPTPTATPVIRSWNISGKMDIWDDENFGGDERGTHIFADSRLLTASQSSSTYVIKRCTGDEVRGEIHLQLQMEAGGAIRVTGALLYFEGTSCSTNDLERKQEINYLLQPSETQSVGILLKDGAGSVYFEFSMSNS